jgi:elongation factor Ts
VAGIALDGPDGDVRPCDEIRRAVHLAEVKTRESVGFVRGVRISGTRVASYLHHNQKVGAVVAIAGELPDPDLRGLCMHIAAARPVCVEVDELPECLVARQKAVFVRLAEEEGKPEAIAQRIADGQIRKFIADRVLLEQDFVRDPTRKVRDVLGYTRIISMAWYVVGQALGQYIPRAVSNSWPDAWDQHA